MSPKKILIADGQQAVYDVTMMIIRNDLQIEGNAEIVGAGQ